MDRRGFLRLAGGAALVVGFDPLTRRWVGATEAHRCSFEHAPTLDGTLLLDRPSRAAVATDTGNLVRRVPCAVLRPGSVEDVRKMIDFCRRNGIPVSARGQAHTTDGQGLSDGLIIDNTALHAIHEIGEGYAVVDTGATWRQLVFAAYEEGWTPPSLTGYIGLSIGGTLSVGGIGGVKGSTKHGMQVDHVRELEVVTGAGDVLACSEGSNRELFDAVLAGLGQCGVMTKARMDLVPAKQRARTYLLHYTDTRTYFHDFRTLLERPGIDHAYTLWYPPGTNALHQLNATVFYDLDEPPDDLRLTAGLAVPPVIQDFAYLDYVVQVDNAIDTFRATIEWDRLIKPWFDVWLPDRAIESVVGEIVPTLTHRDLGATGFVLVFAQRRSQLTRPLMRVANDDGSPWVWLFDVLGTSDRPGPDPDYVREMRARNNRWFARARDVYGGVRYPIGTLDFDHHDWIRHYGPAWPSFARAKATFDPDRILGRGAGIFA